MGEVRAVRLALLVLTLSAAVFILLALRVGFYSKYGRQKKYTPYYPVAEAALPMMGVCEDPSGGFVGWKQGSVTVWKPEIAVNCSKAMLGDKEEIEWARTKVASWKSVISDADMLMKVRNCSWLQEYFNNTLYTSKLERSFPLAFTLLVYESPQQVLRLLRLLYRPQNSYCIHYDVKSKHKEFFESIAKCFLNVIIASKLERVVWSHYSILAAQMNCMRDLLSFREKHIYKWKYVMNICGKELPLITLREFVTRLMRLNGSSSIVSGRPTDNEDMARIKFPVRYNRDKTGFVTDYRRRLGKPPFDVKTHYYKSESYVIVSHAFAEYLIRDSTANKVHNFFKRCKNPEEHFYATMFHWDGAPGGYDPRYKDLYFHGESVFWTVSGERKCRGKEVHNVCIACLADLPEILDSYRTSEYVFHNKYFMEYDHLVMRCMEERIVQRNKEEYEMECLNNG